MLKSTPLLHKRTLLVAAVLSASACSTLPTLSGFKFGPSSESASETSTLTATETLRLGNAAMRSEGIEGTKGQSLANKSLSQEILPAIKIQELPWSTNLQTSAATFAAGSRQPTKEMIARASIRPHSDVLPGEQKQQHAGEHMLHEVASGENLWKIAKLTTGNALNWDALANINNLQPDAFVFPGQQLVIPASLMAEESVIASQTPANAFKLNEGETLWKFSKRTTGNATNWQSIASYNNFTQEQPVIVYPGQTILVPLSLVSGSDVAMDAAAAISDSDVVSADPKMTSNVTIASQ